MLTESEAATRATFDEKWKTIQRWNPDYVRLNSLPWLAKKYQLLDIDALRAFIRTKRRILDGGCGLGYTLKFFAETNPEAEVWGYDFSPEALKYAGEATASYPNVKLAQSTHLTCGAQLPNEYFDLVQSEGTVMCCADPARAVKNLAQLLAPGGTLMIHVYRVMGPLREATDDVLCRMCQTLPFSQQWAFSRFFTMLGKKLFEAFDADGRPLTIDVPPAVASLLQCQTGPQPMQQFLYEAVMQVFWDWSGGHTTVEENTQEQFDWFSPALATRHTADEVRGWADAAGLTVTWLGDGAANAKGITLLATK